MSKNTYIVFTLCVAVFLKLSFFNISFLISGNLCQIESLSSSPVFKVGKSRRRVMDYMVQTDDRHDSVEQVSAELPDDRGLRNFSRRIKLPVISLFRRINTLFDLHYRLLPAQRIITYVESPFGKLPSVSFPELSVLRI
ncbi:MAG: hypothetical protein JST26_16585 [Bacteroidetes bacterium]|nr:hypothetical protein [Bacteroidota bacterium]